MPKPNRYHPYARPSSLSQASNQQTPPPRYPSPPTRQHRTPSLASTPEPTTTPPLSKYRVTPPPPILTAPTSQPIETYESIHPGYIRAVTSNGAPLVAKSILRSEDGTYFVKMEIVGLPSTVTSSAGQENPGLSGMTHYPVQKPHFQLQYEQATYDIFLGGLGYGGGAYGGETRHLGSGQTLRYPSPSASSERGSVGNGTDEHGLATGCSEDEDAEGEEDVE